MTKREVGSTLVSLWMIFCLAILQPSLSAAEEPTQSAGSSVSSQTANTIIWLKAVNENGFERSDEEMNNLAQALMSAAKLAKVSGDFKVLAYPAMGAAVIAANARVTKQVLAQLGKLSIDDSNPNRARDAAALSAIDAATEDISVSLFDTTCDDDGASDLTGTDNKPANIMRVWNGAIVSSPTTRGSVWVIDSGLDSKVIDANLVKVDMSGATLARNCTRPDPQDPSNPSKCKRSGYDNDPIGHGTMIAGIIGGKNGTTPAGIALGMLGVSPGVNVIPVKIFGNKGAADFSNAPMRGLNWVLSKVQAQDVVNISWGGYWIDNLRPGYLQNTVQMIMTRVRAMADKGAIVVIAAGNADPTLRAAWLQFVVPANTTGYKSTVAASGAIYAVAAVQSVASGSSWTDTFWEELDPDGNNRALSNFGLGRPGDPLKGVLAEPGVDVQGLWPATRRAGNLVFQTNQCTGTSFAAAHLSGLLAQKDPVLGQSPPTDDPIDRTTGGIGTRVGTLQ